MPLVAVLVALALAGCQPSEPRKPTRAPGTVATSDDLETVKLFEVDGCRVYRFTEDRTRANAWHYLTTCPGAVVSYRSESCGKGCTRLVPEESPTVRRPGNG